jgi:hypothetical protein
VFDVVVSGDGKDELAGEIRPPIEAVESGGRAT